MWKGLAIFSGILLLGAAGVNYMTVAQMSNENKLRTDAEKNAADSAAHVKASSQNRDDNKKALTEQTSLTQQMARDLTDAKNKKEVVVKKLEADTATLTDVKKKKSDLDQTLESLGGLKVIVEELKGLAAKKTENDAALANKEAVQTLALQKKQQTDNTIAGMKKKDLMQKTGLMNDSFSGAISGIDPQWGFIMINKGNSSNVVKGAKLNVKRGSQQIATLVVTNVQPSSAICDVVPGTLAAGQILQPGDRLVVNETSSEKNAAAPTDAPDGGAAAPAAPAAAPTAPAAAPASTAPDPFAPAAGAAPAPSSAEPAPMTEAPATN